MGSYNKYLLNKIRERLIFRASLTNFDFIKITSVN